jgi:hypothetical protein
VIQNLRKLVAACSGTTGPEADGLRIVKASGNIIVVMGGSLFRNFNSKQLLNIP